MASFIKQNPKTTLEALVKAARDAGATVKVSLTKPILYNCEQENIQQLTFKINSGGDLQVKETGEVVIVFKNRKFDSARFPFTGPYSRNGWRILAEMESIITALEESFHQPTNT